jgi:hypothetical protein
MFKEEVRMKKFIVLALLIALCAGIAFADGVSIGAWGRGIWAPVVSTVDNSGSQAFTGSTGVSWGTPNARTGFQVNGTSEFAGFHVTVQADSGSLGISDDVYGWVKPLPGLMLQVGKVYNDTLRGNAGFGSWNWIRQQSTSFGDDYIFTRIGGNGGAPSNAVLSFTYGGLFIYVEQAFSSTTTFYGDSTNGNGNPINHTSVGAGYTIEGIGKIRVQRIGLDDSPNVSTTSTFYDSKYTEVQAAFNLTAVKDLNVDIGVKVPVYLNTNYKTPVTAQIPLYATYKIAGATISLAGAVQLNTADGLGSSNYGIQGALGLGYDFGVMGLGLDADVRYINKYFVGYPSGTTQDSVVSVLVGLTKGFSNGMVGIGVEYCTTQNSWGYGDATKGQFAVPIKYEYWF